MERVVKMTTDNEILIRAAEEKATHPAFWNSTEDDGDFDEDEVSEEEARIALHVVEETGSVKYMEIALSCGWDINEIWRGGTMLCHSADKGYLELCEFLLEKGADPLIGEDHEGLIPIAIAYLNGHFKICELLARKASSVRTT
jgi:ankyrin repeat protein